MKIIFFTLFFSYALVPDLNAQFSCGTLTLDETPPESELPEWYFDCVDPEGPFFIKVYPHIIRDNNGDGGVSYRSVVEAISRMNSVYNIHNIFFIQDCSENPYINSDEYFKEARANKCDLWNMYNHEDGIDMYFDDEEASEHGGEAIDIPGDAFIVDGIWDAYPFYPNDICVETHTVSHEMGHCLGLYHTHHMIEPAGATDCTTSYHPAGTIENENNCDTAGDMCCDTPPDPDMLFSVSYEDDCYFVLLMDPLYEGFDPDTRNIMGLTVPACMDHFTPDQGKLMRCGIYNTFDHELISFEKDLEITTSTEWDEDPEYIIIGTLTITTGNTLTIDEGVTVRFLEGASLIVEKGATLNLYGTLTSTGCHRYWNGVKVYGDSEHNQAYSAGYHQGFLKGFPGSVIENAVTAVELWGPTEEDAGGVIICTETSFLNNKIGVSFLPYQNLYSGQPRPYVGVFKLCDFIISDEYPFLSFDEHAVLSGVDGIRFSGCSFENYFVNENDEHQYDRGFGISADNSGFRVNAANTGASIPGPCIPGTCEIVRRSQFVGLGTGIRTASYGENRIFEIYQAQFGACHTGIEVDGVSGGVMLFNRFDLGDVFDSDLLNGDQIGIKLNNQIAAFTIEQDTFISGSGNVENTIGISVENIGDMGNVIRKNYFNGLTLSNEAFGKNAGVGALLYTGLRYICNENINTIDKDFYVKNTTQYSPDNINALQGDLSLIDITRAAGNLFSSTGSSVDGDFANYGVAIDRYIHDTSDGVLDDFTGITQVVTGNPNPCSVNYCAPPCLSGPNLTGLKENYYSLVPEFEDAVSEDRELAAGLIKLSMDTAAKIIIQHVLVDSSSFNRDTLRKWYSNLLTLSGDILLAKDYASEGDFASANQVLIDAFSRFTLTSQEENDLSNIEVIFDILERNPPSAMPNGAIDTLLSITDSLGHCASMARSILALRGYHFETNYVLPSYSPPGFATNPGFVNHYDDEYKIYPNPNFGEVINVDLPNIDFDQNIQFELWSMDGAKISSLSLFSNFSELKFGYALNGLYAYRVTANGNLLKSGRIVFLK